MIKHTSSKNFNNKIIQSIFILSRLSNFNIAYNFTYLILFQSLKILVFVFNVAMLSFSFCVGNSLDNIFVFCCVLLEVRGISEHFQKTDPIHIISYSYFNLIFTSRSLKILTQTNFYPITYNQMERNIFHMFSFMSMFVLITFILISRP